METDELKRQFKELTGFNPMSWQTRLYLEYFDRGKIPAGADLPTGLGKTAVIALWLIAILQNKPLPRRLVYVVDRRAVVDQATDFVETLRTRLPAEQHIAVSTLRGQHADNREWLDDPSKPAIIIATVDMIGSRLLFEGYGVSRKMRPYHAGMLGADTLFVLDEAHLVPPFERLLEDIEQDQPRLAPANDADRQLIPPLKLLSLSATGRERNGDIFRLSNADIESCSLTRQRLHAPKELVIRQADLKTLSDQLADTAWALTDSGSSPLRVLVYCNARKDAEKVHAGLMKKAKPINKNGPLTVEAELFTGARRGHERDQAARRLEELGFIAGSAPAPNKVCFLVATSAGEVGIDLDADHMVCDLEAWERMVQRLGRVNRRGKNQAKVIVVDAGPQQQSAKKQDGEKSHAALQRLLKALPTRGEGHDASPEAIRQLKLTANSEIKAALEQATTPAPLRPAITRPLLEAWAMTTLKTHTGRPEIAPWLRGWIDEEPQTRVIWRHYLPVPEGATTEVPTKWSKQATAYFEATPIHVSEQLETETRNVADWLIQRAKQLNSAVDKDQIQTLPPVIAISLGNAGDVVAAHTAAKLSDSDKKQLQRELAGKTLVVDSTVAGLSSSGTLDPKEDTVPDWLGDMQASVNPDNSDTPRIQWRVVHTDRDSDTDIPTLGSGWYPHFQLTLKQDAEGEPLSRLMVYKWKTSAATEDDRAIGHEQSLEDHQNQASRRAREIGNRLGLPDSYINLLALAARLHDEGKREFCWQQAFNAPPHGRPYAKTRGPVNVQLLGDYRHEFGSLFYAENDPEFQALIEDDKNLVLHLIAAHHGNARPTISTSGFKKAPPSRLEARARDVALRYARLQRRWGPWGLAWWETLLRAADQQASRDNEQGEQD